METKVIYNESIVDISKLPTRQDAAFYTWGPGPTNVATITRGGRKLYIDCVGEMYLVVPSIDGDKVVEDSVIRYSDDLENAGITSDEILNYVTTYWSMKNGYEIWHMNSWFEVYSDVEDFGYNVWHEVDEAVEACKGYLLEDEYWENVS